MPQGIQKCKVYDVYRKYIFLKSLADISPFGGTTNTPIIIHFWWRLLCVSKLEWAGLFMLSRGVSVTHSLKFISGMITADPATKPFSSTYLRVGICGARNRDLSCRLCLRVWDQANAAKTIYLTYYLKILQVMFWNNFSFQFLSLWGSRGTFSRFW